MHRIFTTASFKLTLLYAVIFSISMLLLALLMFFSIRASLQQQIRTHIEAESSQLMGDYQDDGLDELRHDIRERIEKALPARLYYTIQRPDGRAIFDKLPRLTHVGWQTVTNRDGIPLLINSKLLNNDYMLLVGADLSEMKSVESVMKQRLFLALGLTLLIAVLSGLWASRHFLRRVDNLAKTTERIGDGFLSERIEVRGNQDEFDQLAIAINRMLQRIEVLVENLQHVSTNIAHDLRTPLGQLQQKIEAMEPSPQQQESLQLLDEALATFSALLRIAEIESGAQRETFASVALSDVLQRLAETYLPLAEENTHRLQTDITPDIFIHGDERLLVQLVVNLLENAIIHSGPESLIMLRLTSQGDLIISDSGPGIPETQREDVLKPFYRLDRSRHRKGNGLGLNLVQAIVAMHGANIALVDNRPGLKVTVSSWRQI
jgi:signal transduction histidine kinase